MKFNSRKLSTIALAATIGLAACRAKNESVVSMNLSGNNQIQSQSAPEQAKPGGETNSQNATVKTNVETKAAIPPLDLTGLQKLSVGGNIPGVGDVQVTLGLDGKIVVEKISKDAAGNLSATPLVEINKPEIIATITQQLKTNLVKVPELVKPYIPTPGAAASMTLEINGQKLSVDLSAAGDAAKPILEIYSQILALVGTAALIPK